MSRYRLHQRGRPRCRHRWLPGWLERSWLGVGIGGVVQCSRCGARWRWDGPFHRYLRID